MADLDAALVLRLVDRLSGPLKKAVGGMRRAVKDAERKTGVSLKQAFSPEALEKTVDKAEKRYSKARSKLTGAFATAVALIAPIKQLGDFEERLLTYATTAGISAQKTKAIGTELRRLAPVANKTASEMLTALEFLVGKGMNEKTALKALGAVAKSSTATKATIEDMAKAAYAAIDNLKVPAERAQLAIDAMNMAGKAGGFEIRNMARHFPMLTAQAQALGEKGVPAVARIAAALQIALKGAGSPDQAANNMANFLGKLTSPDTVKKFKKMGINLQAEMTKATKAGVSPFEHMLEVIQKATKGDQFKLGKLFADKQVLDFLKPMLANMDEYRKIRDQALAAQGVTNKDYALVMSGLNAKAKAAAIGLSNLLSAGEVLLPILKDIMDTTTKVVGAIGQWAKANPELAGALVKGAAAMMALSVASALVNFAFAGLVLKGWKIVRFLVKLGGGKWGMAFKALGRGALFLSKGLGRLALVALPMVGRALITMGAAAWANPIILIAAAIAGAALLIYANWDKLAAFIKPFWDKVVAGWDEKGLYGVGEVIIKALADGVKTGLKELLNVFVRLNIEIANAIVTSSLFQKGVAIVQSMIDGVKSKGAELLNWFKTLPQRIMAMIGNIDLSNIIKWPSLPGWLGGGKAKVAGAATATKAKPTARARGGGFHAGQSLQVGEKGTEMVTFNRSGTVTPNHALGGGRSTSVSIGDIHIHGNADRSIASDIASEIERRMRSALHDGVETA